MSDDRPSNLPAKQKHKPPQAFIDNQWKPGQSGNPLGRGREYLRCQQLCRVHSEEAAEEIIRLFKHSDDDRVRLMAAQWTYERAWGKPKEFDPDTQSTDLHAILSRLSPEARAKLHAAMMVAQELVQEHGG